MIIEVILNHKVQYSERIAIEYSISDNTDENIISDMECIQDDLWIYKLQGIWPDHNIKYRFVIFDHEGKQIHKESSYHNIYSNDYRGNLTTVYTEYRTTDSILYHNAISKMTLNTAHSPYNNIHPNKNNIQIRLYAPYIKNSDMVYIVGANDKLGQWNPETGLPLIKDGTGYHTLSIDKEYIISGNIEYKFVIKDSINGHIFWQSYDNLSTKKLQTFGNKINIREHCNVFFDNYFPRFAGVVAPIFSLRHKKDYGIGDFAGLDLLIEWAYQCGMSVIQLLPINDTCLTLSDRDSYPYNAISTKAINPMYMDMNPFYNDNEAEPHRLNQYEKIDYENVEKLKYNTILSNSIKAIQDQSTLSEISEFAQDNEDWIFHYAIHCLKSKVGMSFDNVRRRSSDIHSMGKDEIAKVFRTEILQIYWIQYVLHKQLENISNKALTKGIIIKGDLPIGVNPNGVEVEENPSLFNTDVSAGAPPDYFARDGQNWGFPTYNWENIKNDQNYSWWRERLKHTEHFFSAIRIDHVLGFFRIWEIPNDQQSGLLGYFNPDMPLSGDEINNILQHPWSAENLSIPLISKEYLIELFGDNIQMLEDRGDIRKTDLNDFYTLRSDKQCDYNPNNDTDNKLRKLCTERLFLRDNNSSNLYHPRINPEWTKIFCILDSDTQRKIKALTQDYFYSRHEHIWETIGQERLSALQNASDILLCAEDLGMIPACVPNVLDRLSILSLEIERMPKSTQESKWTNLNEIKYLSVISTSTHDMPPLKLWWNELAPEDKTKYLQEKTGQAYSEEKTIYKHILNNHLSTQAMLAIFPLGDWLSFTNIMTQQPNEEQINNPANPNHIWNYRFPFNMEDLIENETITKNIKELIVSNNRL